MNKVRYRRREIDMTQEQLAEMIGSTKSYISDLERLNIRSPSLGRARLLAMALRCDVDYLFPRSTDDESEEKS